MRQRRRAESSAGVAGELPGTLDTPETLAGYRAALREGKSVYVVDDSRSTCESHKAVLDGPFAGQVSFQTDPGKAVDDVALRAAEGRVHALVLDMDMPAVSGREVAVRLAKRGIFIPFVIVSGGQGSEETRRFLGAVSAAKSRQELESAVDARLKGTGGVAFAYVRKEDTVLAPGLLVDAVDAMLLAGRRGVSNLDLMVKATKVEQPSLLGLGLGDKERICAGLADEALAMYSAHHRFSNRMDALAKAEKPQTGEKDRVKRDLKRLRDHWYFPDDVSYEKIRAAAEKKDDWGYFRHDLLGSRGMHGIFDAMRGLRHGFAEGSGARAEVERQFTLLTRLLVRFRNLEDRLTGYGQMSREVSKTVKVLGSVEKVPLEVTGEVSIGDDDGRILHMALSQAIVNAGHAVKGREGGRVIAELGRVRVADIGSERVRAILEGKGHGHESEVGYVAISDNGPGISQEIVEAWRRGEEVTSTKTGVRAEGIALMRDVMGDIDGAADLENTGSGTKATLYFHAAKEAGK